LKAIVVSATIGKETFENTMKLMATTLIAQGNIEEGIQFFCLIGKRYEL
jgi:hypothetical protein